MKVADRMTTPVHTVSSGQSVRYASELMDRLRIGSLVVLEADRVVGILTSRNARSAHPNRIVADAMTPNPVSVEADAFVWDAVRLMDKCGFERLVVMRDGRLAGIVTREALATVLSEWKDPLTQLYRAPYIQAIGEELLTRKEPFHLLFIDLDRFGEVNKRFGHPIGDDMIRGFAQRLKLLFGKEDYLCRYAGDEFIAVTKQPNSIVGQQVAALSGEFEVGPVRVSATVGWISPQSEPDFFRLSFRELILRASLMSTEGKPVRF